MSETVGYMQTTACALCGTTARAFVERYFYADETRAKFVVTLEHRGVKRATGCEACFRKAMQDEAAPSPSAAHAALLAEAERAIAHTHHRCTTPTMHAMTNEPSLDDPGTRSIDCIVADLAAALRSASPSPFTDADKAELYRTGWEAGRASAVKESLITPGAVEAVPVAVSDSAEYVLRQLREDYAEDYSTRDIRAVCEWVQRLAARRGAEGGTDV